LVAQGHAAPAASLFIYGMILTMITDNYVRPALIGGAVKLPFLWTLLGIFAGMESLGFLGLFLGPTLMAVLMSLWRDWIADVDQSAEKDVITNQSAHIVDEQLLSLSPTEFDDGQ
jgi:predicted PurR-regulated permease PerM